MTPTECREAANDNAPMSRREMLEKADAILKANPEPSRPAVRVRYRGGRSAVTWLAKHDPEGAAALWLIARQRLLQPANDNRAVAGLRLDRRKDGKPRGRNADPRSLAAYLALPSVKPRLGDADPQPAPRAEWAGEARGIAIKCQDWLHPEAEITESTCFGYCSPAIAYGASFLGANGGLGQVKVGKRHGDARQVEAQPIVELPPEVESVIEVLLAAGNVADVGEALGARGGYRDRKGGKALRAAAEWAKVAIAA